jgi:hypothetical protein
MNLIKDTECGGRIQLRSGSVEEGFNWDQDPWRKDSTEIRSVEEGFN